MRPTADMATLPTEIVFEGMTLPISTYEQLEQQSRKNLMGKVATLKQAVGAERLPALTGHGPDLTIDWILVVQQGLVRNVTGHTFSLAEFGAPPKANEDGYFGRPLGGAAPAPQKQYAQQQPEQQRMPMQQANNVQSNYDAYAAACNGAEQARRRNQGSNIFG